MYNVTFSSQYSHVYRYGLEVEIQVDFSASKGATSDEIVLVEHMDSHYCPKHNIMIDGVNQGGDPYLLTISTSGKISLYTLGKAVNGAYRNHITYTGK